jgi:hypothetical protein
MFIPAVKVVQTENTEERKSWEEYVSIGMVAREEADGCQWKLGDLAKEIEKDYGQDSLGKYSYAIGVAKKTLMVYRTVATKFSLETREKYRKLSFSHFKACTALERPEAWLERADDDNWGVEKLSIEIGKAYEGLTEPDLEDIPPKIYRCEECHQWRLEGVSYHDICRGHYVISNKGMEYK